MPATRLATVKQLVTRNLTLKLLCLAVAVCVWCLSSTNRRTEAERALPLKVTDVPAGFMLKPPPPAAITYTLSGPSILVDGALRTNPGVKLSLAGAARPGRTLFMHLESYLKLPDGVSVIRITPSALELNLEPEYPSAGGQHP